MHKSGTQQNNPTWHHNYKALNKEALNKEKFQTSPHLATAMAMAMVYGYNNI